MILYVTVLSGQVFTGLCAGVTFVFAPITPRRAANYGVTMGFSSNHVVAVFYGMDDGRSVRLPLVMG